MHVAVLGPNPSAVCSDDILYHHFYTALNRAVKHHISAPSQTLMVRVDWVIGFVEPVLGEGRLSPSLMDVFYCSRACTVYGRVGRTAYTSR